jgi:imidazolonepropionase-like amidohydrolase
MRAMLVFVALAACGPQQRAPVTQRVQVAASVVIRGAHVFDGENDLGVVDVAIDEDRIAAVGRDLPVPQATQVIDASGKFLMPGLIDAHVHVSDPLALEEALAFGVTTVLDQMGPPDVAASLRTAAASNPSLADYRAATNPVLAPGGIGTQFGVVYDTVDDPAKIDERVDAIVAGGADWVKIVDDDGTSLGLPGPMPALDAETIAKAIARAHADGRIAVVHVTQVAAAARVIAAGADGLAHMFADATADAVLINDIKAKGAFVIPTLTAIATLAGERRGAAIAQDPDLAPFLDAGDKDNLTRGIPDPMKKVTKIKLVHALANVKALRDAQVDILAGTDAPNPGMAYGASLHHELALLVEAGLTPPEALRAATATPARRFNLLDRGRIDAGYRADLVLLDADPLVEITATRKISRVWRSGVLYDRELWKQKAATGTAPPPPATGETP